MPGRGIGGSQLSYPSERSTALGFFSWLIAPVFLHESILTRDFSDLGSRRCNHLTPSSDRACNVRIDALGEGYASYSSWLGGPLSSCVVDRLTVKTVQLRMGEGWVTPLAVLDRCLRADAEGNAAKGGDSPRGSLPLTTIVIYGLGCQSAPGVLPAKHRRIVTSGFLFGPVRFGL